VRVLLPSKNYRANIWSNQISAFLDIESDVIEQKHWQKNGQQFVDFELFLHTFIEPDEVLILKIIKNATEEKQGVDEKDEQRDAPPTKSQSL